MDIYGYIKADYRRVTKLINDLMAINLPAIRQSLIQQIRMEVNAHTAAKEQTFYQALEMASGNRAISDRLGRCVEAHTEIRHLLDVLTDTPIASDFWVEKFGEFRHALNQCIREEETDIFRKAVMLLPSAQARQLSRDMDALKAHWLAYEPAE